MTRVLRRLAGALVAAAAVAVLVVAAHGHAPTAEQRAHAIDRELRCPVCQGLSVADSPSSTSRAIAADVQRRVVAGQSDRQIKAYYVARYGSWILLTPTSGAGRLAWALPVALVAVAAIGLAGALRRWSRRARAPSADDVAVVAQIRRSAVSRMEPSS